MKTISLIMLSVILLALPNEALSRTLAYLFTPENVYKFDTDTDAIVSKVTAPQHVMGSMDIRNGGCVIDVANKFLISGYEEAGGGFYVYDLQTLKEVKDVSFPDIVKQVIDFKIIFPPKGTKFYIQILDGQINNGQKGMITLAYDKKTQEYLGTSENVLLRLAGETFWFSGNQNTIYVATKEGNIRVYDAQALNLLNTIDLSSVFSQTVWGKTIDDINNDNILLGENNKLQKTDKAKYSFRTYKITDGTKTARYELPDIGSMDQALLIPNSTKVVFNDIQYAPTSLPFPPKGTVSSAVLHIYDINSGNKLGMVSFNSNFGGTIFGIRPAGDKLYYYTHTDDKISVIDLNTYIVIKQIEVSEVQFMIFFEE